MRVRIGNKLILFRSKVITLSGENPRVGINSGGPHIGSHFLFLDYDGKDFDCESEFMSIIREYKLRRGVVMDSGKGYHCISFSPLPFATMLEIVSKAHCCQSFKKCVMANGYATLRITPKRKKPIGFYAFLNNPYGRNFYDFDREKAYLEVVRG